MFLIQYGKGHFIDAERILWVATNKERVAFGVVGEPEGEWKVDEDFTDTFLNNLQAINANKANNVQTCYNQMHT